MVAPAHAALVVIDAQEEYFAPIGKVVLPGGPAAAAQIARTLAWARGAGVPLVHIVHENRRPGGTIFVPGSPGLAIRPEAAPKPGEPVLQKHLPGSFTGTGLEAFLRERGIERLLITGFMTQMCVDTTARQAAHLGFSATVLADACAAKSVTGPDGVAIDAEQVHRTHLGSLQGYLAEIRHVDDIVG
jgi:nicotinamidase-related amidase